MTSYRILNGLSLERVNRVSIRTLSIVRWSLAGILCFCLSKDESEARSPDLADAKTEKAFGDVQLDKRIAELIDELGSDHYATRRQAQEQLQHIGVPALDQLQTAILNSDPQIATAARYMVRSSFFNWTDQNDPLEVRKLLEHYGTNDEAYREDRIKRLASLKSDRGLPALLRISRYEVSGRLSRQAAFLILDASSQRASHSNETQIRQRWESVLAVSEKGRNQASEWLTEFGRIKTFEKKLDPSFWLEAIQKESDLLKNKPLETSRIIISEFSRFVSEQLSAHQMPNEALQVAMGLTETEYNERDRLYRALDLCLWALENGFPSVVIEQCEKTWIKSIRHTHLDYLLAEAYQKLGEMDRAEEFALRAFSRGNSIATMEFSLFDRKDKGEFLNRRKQYIWAEREFRSALEKADPLDKSTVELIYLMSNMLVDGLDHAGAVEILKPLIDRFEKEPSFARQIDRDPDFSRENGIDDAPVATFSESLSAQYLHFRAIHQIKSNHLEDAKQNLRDALKADPDNIDIAITMWKNRSDDDWNRESEIAIQKAVHHFREAIPKLERAVRSNSPNDFATYQKAYVNTLNTFAWLLVSTDRELDTAIECSQLACRMQPYRAAYLDTMARCYFKDGRIEEAIQTQKDAVALEPYSREITRALTEYQSALTQKPSVP